MCACICNFLSTKHWCITRSVVRNAGGGTGAQICMEHSRTRQAGKLQCSGSAGCWRRLLILLPLAKINRKPAHAASVCCLKRRMSNVSGILSCHPWFNYIKSSYISVGNTITSRPLTSFSTCRYRIRWYGDRGSYTTSPVFFHCRKPVQHGCMWIEQWMRATATKPELHTATHLLTSLAEGRRGEKQTFELEAKRVKKRRQVKRCYSQR